jgi:ATP-dependent RNA helicase DDX49/DBP8
MEDDDEFQLFSAKKLEQKKQKSVANVTASASVDKTKSHGKSKEVTEPAAVEPECTAVVHDEHAASDSDSDEDGHSTKRRATFASIGLAPWLQKQCVQMGMPRPTEIQERCIPRILKGKLSLATNCTGLVMIEPSALQ